MESFLVCISGLTSDKCHFSEKADEKTDHINIQSNVSCAFLKENGV